MGKLSDFPGVVNFRSDRQLSLCCDEIANYGKADCLLKKDLGRQFSTACAEPIASEIAETYWFRSIYDRDAGLIRVSC
jgi:hypothetical protein